MDNIYRGSCGDGYKLCSNTVKVVSDSHGITAGAVSTLQSAVLSSLMLLSYDHL